MISVSISKAWDETRAILARDGRLLATTAGALLLLPAALSLMIQPQSAETAAQTSLGGSLVGLLANLLMLSGLLAITAIALQRGATVGEAVTTGFRKLLPALGATLLWLFPLILLLGIVLVAAVGGQNVTDLQARLEAGQVGGGLLLAIFLFLILFVYLLVRFMMISPVAVAETSNVVAILKRSWQLTQGNMLRLFGFALLIGLVMLVVSLAATAVAGLLTAATLGPAEPLSLSALLVGLVTGAVNAAAQTVYAVMVARLYLQLVPESKLADVFG